MASQTKKRKILRKLKEYNTIWHPDSTLVFKSQKERLVIGRLVDKKLIPLDDEALELCEEWNYKADESLLKKSEETEESNNEESEDQESNDESNTNDDEKENSATESDDQEEKEQTEPETQVNTTVEKETDFALVNAFTVFYNDYKQTLTSSLTNNAGEISSLKTENENLKSELGELKSKYKNIMKKFDTMKSLFS